MSANAAHIMHLGIAEQGKILLLDGDHDEALRHFREAIRIAVSARAPEVFFRHYTQCVLEALELAGHYEEVIAFCEEADAHYAGLDASLAIQAKDHGAILERQAVALISAGRADEAAPILKRAIETAGARVLPLAESLLAWLTRGYSVPGPQLRQAQKRHNYFVVRKDTLQRDIARPLPESSGAAAMPGLPA